MSILQECNAQAKQTLLGTAIGRTRVLTDSEKFELLTTSQLQDNSIDDDDLDVQLKEEEKQRKSNFKDVGYVSIIG